MEVNESSNINAVSVGGTIAALFVTAVVSILVTLLAGAVVTFINYYMSSMRIEAAGFFGAIAGGVAGTYAARASCDAILKAYHKRAVFMLFVVLICLGIYLEFFISPVGWRTLAPVAQMVAIAITAWIWFWKGEDI